MDIDNKIRSLHWHENQLNDIEKELSILGARKSGMKISIETLKNSIANEMVETGCVQSTVDGLVWSLRVTPVSVIITDEAALPESFMCTKVTKAPDKIAIKKAIASGEEVAGAMLSNGGITVVAKGVK